MNEVRVFDASALIALFRSQDEAYRLFTDADAGLNQLLRRGVRSARRTPI